jgi:hypothetical protein
MSSTTRVQAEALATFVRQLRPDWDHPGIVHAIGRCQREALSEIAVALIRLAENGQAKTPALLPEPGRHWTRAALDDTPAGPNTRNLDHCPIHPGHERRDCRPCRDDHGPTLDDQARAAAADECRGVIAELQRKVRELRAEREALKAGRS